MGGGVAVGRLSGRQRMLVLGVCCLSLLIIGVDITIVNIALPSIEHDLNARVSQLQWTIDAYTVVLASLLMLGGSIGDRFGRRRVFQTGLAVFALASLACGLAPDPGWLIAFRAVQGVGASMLNPVSLSIVRNVFTDEQERARALGVWAGVFGLSMALGPMLGGLLIGAHLGWRAVFWINVPLAVAGIVLTARFVPDSRADHPRRFDPVGQMLVIVMLAAVTVGIIEGPQAGWGSSLVVGSFALAAAALAGVARYEPRRCEPLLELRFFGSVPFSGTSAICCLAFAAFGGFLWVNTLYLQDARGYSALHAGLLTVPMALMSAMIGPPSGRLVARYGSRPALVISGITLTVSALMLAGLTTRTAIGWLIASYAIFGVGFALISTPTNAAALAGMPAAQAGVAASVTSTSRQVGQTLGVAVAGSVIAIGLHGASPAGLTRYSHPVWWLLAGCGAAVTILALLTTSAWARRTAQRTAARLTGSPPGPEQQGRIIHRTPSHRQAQPDAQNP